MFLFSKKIYHFLFLFVFLFFPFLLMASSESFNINGNDSDAIAIRVIPNPENYDINQWYKLQGFTGSPQQITIDGYKAIRDGRTIYVSASNVDLVENKIYFNVYLISYNQEADDNTVDIFGKIIKNLKFNTNLKDYTGYCSISNMVCKKDSDCPSDYICGFNTYGKNRCIIKDGIYNNGPLKKTPCKIDSDCPTSLFCDSLQASITRDMDRVRKLDSIKSALERYKNINGSYPILRSGTYIPYLAISSWPSWQSTFLNQLNIANISDSINTIGSCFDINSEFNLKTCWEPNKKIFVSTEEPITSFNFALPNYSNVFSYVTDPEGESFQLYSSMETFDYYLKDFTFPSGQKMSDISPPYIYRNPYFTKIELSGDSGKIFEGYIGAEDPKNEELTWDLFNCTDGLPLFKEGEITEDYKCLDNDWSTWSLSSWPQKKYIQNNTLFLKSEKAGNSMPINSNIVQEKTKEYIIGVSIKNKSGFETKMNIPIYIKNKNPFIQSNNIYEHNLSTYSDFSFNLNISDNNDIKSVWLCYLGSGTNISTDCINTWNFLPGDFSSKDFFGNNLFYNKIKADFYFENNTYKISIKNKNSPYKGDFNSSHINDHKFRIFADDGYGALTQKDFIIKFTSSKPEIFFDCPKSVILGNNYNCKIYSSKPSETITTTSVDIETPPNSDNFLKYELSNNLIYGLPISDNHLGPYKINVNIKNEFNLSDYNSHTFNVYTAPKLATYDTEEKDINPYSFVCKGLVLSSGHNSNNGYRGCIVGEDPSSLNILSAHDCQSKSYCAGEPGVGDNFPIENSLFGLKRNTKNYYRVFAINEAGIGYGDIKSFQTKATEPKLNIFNPSISNLNINLKSNITDDGGAVLHSRGFFWSKLKNINIPPIVCSLENSCWVETSNSIGEFSKLIDISNFNQGEDYYFKSFAINRDNNTPNREIIGFSNVVPYHVPIIPSISNIIVSDITNNSAKISSNLNNPENLNIEECGLIYSSDPDLNSDDPKIKTNNCSEQLNINLLELSEDSVYYFKFYISGDFGVVYSSENNFKTKKFLYVQYNGNGNTSGTPPSTINVYLGDNFVVSDKNNLDKTGYSFSSWNDSSDGLGKNFIVGNSYKAENNLDLYAKWTANTYTLSFNAQGGTVSPTSKSVTYAQAVGTLPTPTRSGYTFSGWFTSSTGGTQYTSSTVYTQTVGLTLHARWTANTYTITFDRQSGTGGSTSVTATYGSAMPAASAPTRSGYTFAGYFDAASGGTQYYSSSMTSSRNWDKAANTTLYARWTVNQYTITFNANGGSGHTPTSVSANYNSTITLPSNPSRAGYTFAGWFTSPTAGTQFTSSTAVTSSYTVYARWNYFDACYGQTEIKYHNHTYKLTSIGDQCWIRENLKYLPSVYAGSSSSITEPRYYVHSYNGTNVNEAKLSYIYKGYGVLYNYKAALSACPLSWKLPSDEDFKQLERFIGMTESQVNSSGYRGSKGDTLKSCRQVNSPLGGICSTNTHPRWEYNPSNNGTDNYNLSLMGGGYRHHSDGWHVNFLPTAAYLWINSGETTYPYYRYVAYNNSGIGRGSFSSAAGFQVRCILDYISKYKITFDKQGGTYGSSVVMVTYGLDMPGAIAPTKTGYDFVGYFTSPLCKGIKYYDHNMTSILPWDVKGDKTLYACWLHSFIEPDPCPPGEICHEIIQQ